MWKRDEAPRPPQPAAATPAPAVPEPPARVEATRQPGRDLVNIGKSVVIKGELSASEDLTIEGQVEGKVDLRQNTLTIGTNARITAQVSAKVVIVMGHVHGNISATEKVDIRDNGSVDGDLSAPRVAIAEGAHFRGSIDMQQSKTGDTKPAATAAHAAPATPHAATPNAASMTPPAPPATPPVAPAKPPASVGAR
jgi:cytoskeletal protein CcmA (bactofilin family)